MHITLDDLLHENETEAGKKVFFLVPCNPLLHSPPPPPQARRLQLDREEVPEHLWAELLEQRLKEYDCVNRVSMEPVEIIFNMVKIVIFFQGWILEGFPRTRKQVSGVYS